MKGRRHRGLSLLLLVLVLLAALPLVRYLRTPGEARQAAAGLRSSAVFVPPGARGVLDADRVRQVVGDRPLVVAVLAAGYRGDALDGCEAVARQQPRNVVLTYRASDPGGYPTLCHGRSFPEPDVPAPAADDLDRTDLWLFRLGISVQRATVYRVSRTTLDRTPEVESLVLAFDNQVAQDYPDGIPRRVASPEPETLARVLVRLAGLVGLLLALAAALRGVAVLVERRVEGDRALEDRRATLGAQLSAASALLLHARPRSRDAAERLALVAERYLLALQAVEHAATAAQLDEAERAVAELSRSAGVSA